GSLLHDDAVARGQDLEVVAERADRRRRRDRGPPQSRPRGLDVDGAGTGEGVELHPLRHGERPARRGGALEAVLCTRDDAPPEAGAGGERAPEPQREGIRYAVRMHDAAEPGLVRDLQATDDPP